MTAMLWIYGAGMMLTGSLWVWGTLRATRNPDAVKRRAADEAFQWRYFALVLATWPLMLAWIVHEVVRGLRDAV